MGVCQLYVLFVFVVADFCLAKDGGPHPPGMNLTLQPIVDVPAQKKAMIDFSSSEFKDNGESEELEDDASERTLEKEEADYDDAEIEKQEIEEDNDVDDLSGGEPFQSNEEALSFDDNSDESFDDYDVDEDSAAGYDNDDSDATFTESEDEQVMSDISHINDYKDDDEDNNDLQSLIASLNDDTDDGETESENGDDNVENQETGNGGGNQGTADYNAENGPNEDAGTKKQNVAWPKPSDHFAASSRNTANVTGVTSQTRAGIPEHGVGEAVPTPQTVLDGDNLEERSEGTDPSTTDGSNNNVKNGTGDENGIDDSVTGNNEDGENDDKVNYGDDSDTGDSSIGNDGGDTSDSTGDPSDSDGTASFGDDNDAGDSSIGNDGGDGSDSTGDPSDSDGTASFGDDGDTSDSNGGSDEGINGGDAGDGNNANGDDGGDGNDETGSAGGDGSDSKVNYESDSDADDSTTGDDGGDGSDETSDDDEGDDSDDTDDNSSGADGNNGGDSNVSGGSNTGNNGGGGNDSGGSNTGNNGGGGNDSGGSNTGNNGEGGNDSGGSKTGNNGGGEIDSGGSKTSKAGDKDKADFEDIDNDSAGENNDAEFVDGNGDGASDTNGVVNEDSNNSNAVNDDNESFDEDQNTEGDENSQSMIENDSSVDDGNSNNPSTNENNEEVGNSAEQNLESVPEENYIETEAEGSNEETDPMEYFDNEEDDDEEEASIADCEPEEADVRSFRGMITGGMKRFGFLNKLKNLGAAAVNKIKSIFNKNGKKVSTKEIKKKIKEMELTKKPAVMPLPVAKPSKIKYSKWHTKLLAWDWRQFVKGYKYGSASGPVHAAFLADASIRTHMPITQRMIYNLARTFSIADAYYTLASFGKGFNQVTAFKKMANEQELQRYVASIKLDRTKSRRIGEAMENMVKIFAANKAKAPTSKLVLFIIVRGRTYGCLYKLQAAAKSLKAQGVRVYVIGFGTRLILEELAMMTIPERVFRATKYEHVVIGNAKKPSIMIRIQHRLQRWMTGAGGGLGKANVGFLIDTSSVSSRGFLQKLVYNYIRLFQLQGTSFTIYAYGATQQRITTWKSFISPQDIQSTINAIPAVRGSGRKTGQAMVELFKQFTVQSGKNNRPNIAFVINVGKPDDGDILKAIGDKYREKGIKVWALAVNQKAKTFVDDLNKIATKPGYVAFGEKKSFATPERFSAMEDLIKQDSGKGSAVTINVGDTSILAIQKTWDWPKVFKPIQFGALNKANIAFVIEGSFVKNLNYIRRYVYNIIRFFSLSGTYITILDYGEAQYRVANWVMLRNGAQVRRLCNRIPKSKKRARKTGAALRAVLASFSDAPSGNPNIVFLITKGKSQDDYIVPAANLRKKGIITFAIGLTGFAPNTNLGDVGFKQKELALIAFSSSFIFGAKMDGLVTSSGAIFEGLQKLVGKSSPNTGSSGKIDVDDTDVVDNWDWKTYDYNLIYIGLKPANVIFLIDGTSRNHFDALQKTSYNIARLFGRVSNFAFITFGGAVDNTFGAWKNYDGVSSLQLAASALRYYGTGGRRIGLALDAAVKLFGSAPDRSAKKVAFVITTGKSTDDAKGPASKLTGSSVSVFGVGAGPGIRANDMKPISNQYVFGRWRELPKLLVKLQDMVARVVGRNPAQKDVGVVPAPSDKPDVEPPIPPAIDPFINSGSSKDIEKLRSSWDWSKLKSGIVYNTLQTTELVCLVDETDDSNFDIVIKFIYNVIRLFKLGNVKVTLVGFGPRQRIIFRGRTFTKIRQIQTTLVTFRPAAAKKLYVGRALNYIRTQIINKLPRSTPRILLTLLQGSSCDGFQEPANRLKGDGVKLVSIGIGDVSRGEIFGLASTGTYAMQSTFSKLPAVILRIQFILTMAVNGPPQDNKITPENSGTGGADVKDTTTSGSVPDEASGKPDPGKPGGPQKPDSGEGGKGGATGDGPGSDGGTDVAAGGGSKGTNVEPVAPKKPVPRPKPVHPSPNSGGPGTKGTKEEEKPIIEQPGEVKPGEKPSEKKPGEPEKPVQPQIVLPEPGAPETPAQPTGPIAPGKPGVPGGGAPGTPGGGAPGTPGGGAPGTPGGGAPGTPGGGAPGTPEAPEEGKPGRPGAPGGGAPGTPAAPEGGAPGTPEGGKPGAPGGETPPIPGGGTPLAPGGGAPGTPGGGAPGVPGGPAKPPGIGDKEKEKGGDKVSKNQGLNPAGGNTNKDTENGGTNTGPITPISKGGDGDDKEDHVHGGVQVMNISPELLARLSTQWNWEKAINCFGYGTVMPSKVGFIVDGHTSANFELIKRLMFNIARMFRLEGSRFNIVQFGSNPSQVITQQKEVSCASQLMQDIERMKPNPNGQSVVSALNWMQKNYRSREASKRAVFIITQTKFSDNLNTIKSAVSTLQRSSVRVFSIGIGDKIDKVQIGGIVNKNKDFSLMEPVRFAPLSLMTLQLSLLRYIGPGSKLGAHILKQSGVLSESNPNAKPDENKGLLLKVQIKSQGCNDPPNPNRNCATNSGSIKINGRERSVNRRGLNVVVYEFSTGKFVSSKNFDTFGSRAATNRFISFMDKIKPNSLVFVAAKDAFTRTMYSKSYSALYSVGGQEPFVKALRSSYALLGYKGREKMPWTVQKANAPGRGPSIIYAQLMIKTVREEALKPAGESKLVICEGRSGRITCPGGKLIHITAANYGRTGRDECKSRLMKNTNCKASSSENIVKKFCQGQPTCSISARNSLFGDPCRGTYKYLEVKYTCGGQKPSGPALRPPLKIDLKAVGCNDPPARGRCGNTDGSIKINGEEKSLNRRGFNLVVLNYPAGTFHSRANFDTCGDGGASARMLKWVKALPNNKIVLVSTKDDHNIRIRNEAVTAMRLIGGKQNPRLGVRSSYSLLGYKGKGEFSWKQDKANRPGKGPSVISSSIDLPTKVIMPPLPPTARPKYTRNVAKGKSTLQSSNYPGGDSRKAVDGNKNPNWKGKSCTHTFKQANPWWRVDLGRLYTVGKVQLTNRGDCCWKRLRNFEIRVGDVDRRPRANKLCVKYGPAMKKGETRQFECLQPIKGRYVFVVLNVNEWLTLCEVEVYAVAGIPSTPAPPTPQYTGNLAKGKSTSQSSTYPNGQSSKAVDGNSNPSWKGRSCTHTRNQKGAWWRVDLGKRYPVGIVRITNRGDCCWTRLKNFEVRVGDIDGQPKRNNLCFRVPGTMNKGETRDIFCGNPVDGRFVFIVLNGKNYLTLCEVEVLALKGASVETLPPSLYTGNIARGKPTKQSTTGYGGNAGKAVDGNRNARYGAKSCTHTKKQFGPWWRVDLQMMYPISRVRVTNRGDCCWGRLKNFEVRIGNIDNNPQSNALCLRIPGAVGKGETREIACTKPLYGRFVFVILKTKNWLTLCEVEIMAVAGVNPRPFPKPPQYTGNIARGKKTKQISTGYGGPASRAVDGIRKSNYHAKSCTHTHKHKNAWWRVDLGSSQNVGKVIIVNRGDCCHERLRNFEVRVGMVDGNPTANQLCLHYPGSAAKGQTMVLFCNKAIAGKFVYVMLKGKDWLTLCEVEVYAIKGGGQPAPIPPPFQGLQFGGNVAQGKPSSQSSTGPWGGVASRGNDGNANPQWKAKSCTATNKQVRPWWRVDLQGIYTIGKVRITNRQDCCWNRLRNVQVRIGKDASGPDRNPLCSANPGAFARGETRDMLCTRPLKGRYVYVTLMVKEILTVCEVMVYPIKGTVVTEVEKLTGNIAKGKSTRQSTTGYGGVSGRAVDGNTDTKYKGKSCTATKKTKNPWWRVDLASRQEVRKVTLTNRGDCCEKRLRMVEIRVGDTDMYPQRNSLCAFRKEAFGKGETRSLTCVPPRKGRYVFVTLRLTGILTLCEVEVYATRGGGEPLPPPSKPAGKKAMRKSASPTLSDNLARNKETAQSSTAEGGVAARAVDGRHNTLWADGSCTHTKKEDQPWWRVDLGKQQKVKSIKITNRGDCCSDRLSNVEVYVGTSADNPRTSPNQKCTGFQGTFGEGETKTLECSDPKTGNYVFVTLVGNNYLTLCEVEVFALESSGKRNEIIAPIFEDDDIDDSDEFDDEDMQSDTCSVRI